MGGYSHGVGIAGVSLRASAPSKRACGTIWPNGEFGLGYNVQLEESDPVRVNPASGVSLLRMREECEEVAKGGAEGVDLTRLRNSDTAANRPPSYGRKGLSGYGAKMIRNCAHLLQERYGKHVLSFVTLTIPELSASEATDLGEQWGQLMNELIKTVTRWLRKAQLPTDVALVTEIQASRLRRGSPSVLHAHFVMVGKHRGGNWAISPTQLRRWWLDAVSRKIGREVSSGSACDMKPVRKDAGNYLSKYMSKGSEEIEALAEVIGWNAVPRQWWCMSKAARTRTKSACLRSPAAMQWLESHVSEFFYGSSADVFRFVRAIEVEGTEVQTFVVGYWGRLTRKARSVVEGLTKGYDIQEVGF